MQNSSRPERTESPAYQRSLRVMYMMGLGLLSLILATTLIQAKTRVLLVDAPANAHARSIGARIDPNHAAWYDLARLPRIGETLAKRIVTVRDSVAGEGTGTPLESRPFRTADDLRAVKGIGPKTVELLKPYLRFEESAAPIE